VRDNAAWAPPIVFALAFGESLAFISLLIPAWGALVAIGALIGPSGINFWPVWIAAALGAAFGDWLSGSSSSIRWRIFGHCRAIPS
jgi:membrane protein DedA with SNARE-associated domain